MFRTTINLILNEVWPMLLIITVIVSSIRITYIIMNKKKFVLYKELIYLSALLYVLSLFYTVTFQDVSWSTSNFIPFKEMFRYEFGSKIFFKNILGNMIMFVPFGLFTSYVLKNKKIVPIVILSIIASATIETTQLVIGRVFDVDDIMLNIVGAIVGFIIYILSFKINNKLPSCLKKEWVYNIVLVAIFTFAIIYLGGWMF